MPRALSGIRIARSYLTPAGTTAVQRVLDFQLGADDGIEVFSITGDIGMQTTGVGASYVAGSVVQTVHLESGSIEAVPIGTDDEDTIDSEQIYRQTLCHVNYNGTTEAASSMVISPATPVVYPQPLFSARNITHNAIGDLATYVFGCHVLIQYRFVRFSLQELGLILARRS